MAEAERSMRDLALGALPLRIDHVEFVPDPVLSLLGAGWSATFMCDWRVEGRGVDMRWDDELLRDRNEDDAAFLVGRSIEHITAGPEMLDPVFHVSGGFRIHVHADSDLDPWTLHAPGMTLVGYATPRGSHA